LHLEAADEIERQKAELAASQAREAKLRECLHNCYGVDEDGVEYINYSTIEEALALPTDDTALNQVMAECQAREAKLREALETVKVDLIDGRLFAAVVDTKSWHHRVLNAIALPTDDTALKEAIEAALQASPEFDLLNRIGQYLSDVDYIGDYVEGIKQAKR
jgi:hypothetical protein